ncbi:hypothetical protein [Actinoplanes nipponensis]|uniref:hypothetical protein n=1 Tax=Actinoplanes nipponensis TaxID=135950 RepID=UPI001940A11E|nr:hypothetical protein [Actinoplanes nipponensis]
MPRWTPRSATRRRPDGFSELVRQARQGLTGLGLRGRFTEDRLHEKMQAYRGRPVHVIAQPLPPGGPHGLWVAGRDADYVFFPAAASPVRRHVIVGHEYGHMLFDDPAPPLPAPADPTAMDPAELSAAARQARSSYEELPERRAEIFGTLVAQRITDWSRPPARGTESDEAALRRLTGLLESTDENG